MFCRQAWAVEVFRTHDNPRPLVPDVVVQFCDLFATADWRTGPFWLLEFSDDDEAPSALFPACSIVTDTGINDTTLLSHCTGQMAHSFAGTVSMPQPLSCTV